MPKFICILEAADSQAPAIIESVGPFPDECLMPLMKLLREEGMLQSPRSPGRPTQPVYVLEIDQEIYGKYVNDPHAKRKALPLSMQSEELCFKSAFALGVHIGCAPTYPGIALATARRLNPVRPRATVRGVTFCLVDDLD
jgi:hypothetical protein